MKEFECVIKAAGEAMEKLGEFLNAFQEESKKKKVLLSELEPGDKFQTEIGNFIVLEQQDGEAVVITEELYGERVRFSDDTTNYSESSLIKLYDNEIYEEFAKVFGAENIVEHEVDLLTVDGQQLFGKILCKVRPLTFDEARKHTHLLENEELSGWYWTCTSWSSEKRGWKYTVAVVSPSGNVYYNDYFSSFGVRPVCILKSNIFVSKED